MKVLYSNNNKRGGGEHTKALLTQPINGVAKDVMILDETVSLKNNEKYIYKM